MTHTKGLWKVFISTNGAYGIGIDDTDAGGITDANRGLWRSDSERKANAARIVACVNACDGIDNAALDAGIIDELVEAAWRISDHHKIGDLTIHTGLAALSLCNLQNALAKLGQTP